MTFLNTLFLAALPLVAVPVLIHLYRGRQRDVISWGAMDFLAQAVTKGRSMERLEEMVLMALRVAAVAALVLALAQPMVRSSWWSAGSAREVVLLLDDSLSMSREVDGISAGDRLIEHAQAALDDLSASDRVHLLLAAGGGGWLTPEGVIADRVGKLRLRAALETVEPTRGTAALLDSLQMVVALDSVGNPTSRRIVVLTDNQAKSWQIEAEGAWQQLGVARTEADLPTTIEVVDCSLDGAELENLAVMRLEASRLSARPGKPIDFTAEIANVGTLASDDLFVRWLVDGEEFASSELSSLRSQQSAHVTATLAKDEPGTYAVSCLIEAVDQIGLDQQEDVVVEISDQLPILLVHDAEEQALTKSASQLFTAALGYDGDRPQAWHSVYRPTVTTFAQLPGLTLPGYRAVVLNRVDDLDDEMIERLRTYVRGGGGLWITLGDRLDRDAFNRDWYDDGDGLSPLKMESLTRVDDANSPAATIHPPSREHPATAQLANTTQLDIDEARLSEYWRLAQSGARSEAQRDVSVLVETGDGSPLVAENYVGQGRVLVQAFPLGLEWTNLPRLKAYVVMIHDWLDYLTAPAAARYNLDVGNAIVATVPIRAELDGATLQTPAGKTLSLTFQPQGDAATLRYAQTRLPGLYRVTFDGDDSTSLPFHVARDASESKLTMLDADQRNKLAEMAGLVFDANAAAPVAMADPAPRAKPVWGALLAAAVALLAGELLLSSWLARQRRGVAVSTT